MENIKLNAEEYAQILHKALNNPHVIIESTDVKPLSDQIKGYGGNHFIVTINYKKSKDGITETMHFFLKQVTHPTGIVYEIAKSTGTYDKEHYFFHTFMGECEKLNKIIDVSFAPLCYLTRNEEMKMVLQDLGSLGFKNPEKTFTLDLEHAFVALETLAKFHGASIICEEIGKLNFQSETLLSEVMTNKGDTLVSKYFLCSLRGIANLIDVMPEENVPKEKFKSMLQEAIKNSDDFFKPSTVLKNTLNHKDIWANNMMFRYENERPVQCILIDFQLLMYGPPAIDVLYLILNNTRKGLRDTYWGEMLDHYYEKLKNVLEKANLDIYVIIPYDDFKTSTDLYRASVKLQIISARTLTFMPDEIIAEAASSSEKFEKFLLTDRSDVIIKAYQNNSLFAEVLGEDIRELRDMLMNYTF